MTTTTHCCNVENQQAEKALRASEARFASIVNSAMDAIITVDEDHRILLFNAAAEKMFRCRAAEAVGEPIDRFIPERFRGAHARYVKSFGEEGVPTDAMTRARGVYGLRSDGEEFPVEASISQVEADGQKLYTVIMRDNTERERSEQAVVEADCRAITEYQRLLERIAALAQSLGSARDLQIIFRALRDFASISTPCNGVLISLYDLERGVYSAAYAWVDGNEVDVSRLPATPVTAGQRSEFTTGETTATDDVKQIAAELVNVQLRDSTQSTSSSLVVPMAIMRKTVGAVELTSADAAAFKPEHVTAITMAANLAANAIENVWLLERERQSAEELRQSQKLEAIGQLAGGVAHDFNNLLTAIKGYSELTLKGLAKDDPLFRHVEEIRKAGERATSLTRQLLAFGRKQMLQPRIIEINSLIAESGKILRRLLREDIELIMVLRPDVWRIKADPGQIDQVLINLVVNAGDAMPHGGKVTVETSNAEVDEIYAMAHSGVALGPHVVLTVTDTGVGMDEETQKHIFEPFFTTKEVGKGTGLGLSTVYGIVKQSGGSISVYSRPTEGTCFKIYFPRSGDLSGPSTRVAIAENQRGSETILLVEDEPQVRTLAGLILENNGYNVLEAANGDEALRIFEADARQIDLLLTDAVMPLMGGRELVEQASRLRPRMKVLYMSGYTDDAIVRHSLQNPQTPFLQKPFTPESLSRKVRGALDGNHED